MTGLSTELRARLGALARAGQVLIALDFDGTLAPFTDNPEDARALTASVRALEYLDSMPQTDVALISGRDLDSLRRVASPGPQTLLVGSHGAQRWAPESYGAPSADASLSPELRGHLGEIRAVLAGVVEHYEGVWVEDKPAGAVLHTRLAGANAGVATREALAKLDRLKGAHVRTGKDVVEAGVLPANKGEGLLWLRDVTDASIVLFAGDDKTDEDAFAVLRKQDIGIKVGPGKTAAKYRVDGPGDIADLLQMLADVRG